MLITAFSKIFCKLKGAIILLYLVILIFLSMLVNRKASANLGSSAILVMELISSMFNHFWRRSGVFIVNFGQILYIVLMFPLLTLVAIYTFSLFCFSFCSCQLITKIINKMMYFSTAVPIFLTTFRVGDGGNSW